MRTGPATGGYGNRLPYSADYGEPFQIEVQVKKNLLPSRKSWLSPFPSRLENRWSVENFIDEEAAVLEMDGRGLSYSNDFVVTVPAGRTGTVREYSRKEEITIAGAANSPAEHLNLVGNWILNLISRII